jgi:hypothetical protein
MIIKRSKIPTILGIVLLIAATLVGVFLVNSRQIFRLGATGESEPKDIRISNISDSSLTVSWTTDKDTSGFVSWDKGSTSPDEKSTIHLVNLTGLESNTLYNYKINSDGVMFDNNGIDWQAKTSASPLTGKDSTLISGSVLTATGQAVKKALVYINTEGNLFSTLTSSSGNYVFQLPNLNQENSLLEIFVQAGPLGISSAQIYPKSARPVPPMILGNTHDFRNLPASDSGSVPGASLSLPANAEDESKFSIPDSQTPSSSSAVTLESVDENETVTSTQPEFFGQGPEGTELTIKVESENPITDSVSVSSNGSWNWNPPENLSPGTHKMTITWKDLSGITRSLTRNFVVQAGEAPAFEASGSAQTSTPTPSATPKTTASPKATSTASASASPIPETGSLTPTLLLSIMGIAVMAFSFVIWKHAQSI